MFQPESPFYGQSSIYGKVCPDVFGLDSAIRVSGVVLNKPCHEKICLNLAANIEDLNQSLTLWNLAIVFA